MASKQSTCARDASLSPDNPVQHLLTICSTHRSMSLECVYNVTSYALHRYRHTSTSGVHNVIV